MQTIFNNRNGKRRILNLLFVLCVTLIIAAPSKAETYYVATNGIDARTGTGEWTNAVKTISNALSKATTEGNIVLVSNGTHVLTSELRITNSVTVISLSGPNQTILDGNYPTRINRSVRLNHSNAVFAGFTISNSAVATGTSADNCGGGLLIDNGGGTASNCLITHCLAWRAGGGAAVCGEFSLLTDSTIRSCWARDVGGGGLLLTNSGTAARMLIENCWSLQDGGGIYITDGTGVVFESTIYSNSAADDAGGIRGGLIYNCVIISNNAVNRGGGIVGAALLTNCLIAYNTTQTNEGGGVYQAGNILNCRIEHNIAANRGGGIYSTGSRIVQSTINNNKAECQFNAGGGGISMHISGTLQIENCLIYSNNALGSVACGGVYVYRRPSYITNCTIVLNSGHYGGLALNREPTAPSTNILVNSIVYFNEGTSSSNWFRNNSTNDLWFYNCCLAPMPDWGSNNITVDPRLRALTNGDFRLQSDSPCINRGLNAAWMTDALDFGRHPRLDRFSGQVDIGAYEYVPEGMLFKTR